MGLTAAGGISAATVFIQGILSFFSPCVLPLVPLYLGYLAGGAKKMGPDGRICYPKGKILLHTLFFILGISAAFFLLGFGFTALGTALKEYGIWFARAGGGIMILFGLYQLGVFGKRLTMEKERRLPFRLDRWAMNPIVALVLGFCFSFAWTPCVGPALTGVLLMASAAGPAVKGFLLIGLYTLGFVLPFFLVGLFTTSVLTFFKKHQRVIEYTVKISAVLLIGMGILTITGVLGKTGSQSPSQAPGTAPLPTETAQETSAPTETPRAMAPDFTLYDQYGRAHTLSEYRGKVVFLNFWATWCGPCQQEMPEIQRLYLAHGENQADVIILGMANPRSQEYPHNSDDKEPVVKDFLQDNGYTFPVVMDRTGALFSEYGIEAFPTTFMIDGEGRVFGYIQGQLSYGMMEDIIEQTKLGVRRD